MKTIPSLKLRLVQHHTNPTRERGPTARPHRFAIGLCAITINGVSDGLQPARPCPLRQRDVLYYNH